MAQKVEGNSKVNDVTNVEGEWVRKRGMKMGGGGMLLKEQIQWIFRKYQLVLSAWSSLTNLLKKFQWSERAQGGNNTAIICISSLYSNSFPNKLKDK